MQHLHWKTHCVKAICPDTSVPKEKERGYWNVNGLFFLFHDDAFRVLFEKRPRT